MQMKILRLEEEDITSFCGVKSWYVSNGSSYLCRQTGDIGSLQVSPNVPAWTDRVTDRGEEGGADVDEFGTEVVLFLYFDNCERFRSLNIYIW